MAQVFISHTAEDGRFAELIAYALDQAGLTSWHYQRDTLPGLSYLHQISRAIEDSQVLIVIVSNDSLGSEQMTNEIVHGFELKKPFVPLLWNLSHADFQKRQPEWRAAFRAATTLQIPPEGVEPILPRIISGLTQLGVVPQVTVQPLLPSVVAPKSLVSEPTPVGAPGRDESKLARVHIAATFDQSSYPLGSDALAYWLAEFRLTMEGEVVEDGPGADVALVLDVSGSMDKPNRYPLLCQAVRRLVSGLGHDDRVSVTLFTDRAKTVVPFVSGEAAAADPERIVDAMNESGLLFGSRTLLAPGLALALNGLGPVARSEGRVRRTYVLTDGELHDPDACEVALEGYRPKLVEVHVYGFGDGFDALSLKRLVSDQIGGTVKPILNEEGIVKTFSHVATVNRRLVGQAGTLSVTFPPGVVCGDAWVFHPNARYLGAIQDRRVNHLFGGFEAGRRYSLLLETRIPSDSDLVGILKADWIEKDLHRYEEIEVKVSRGEKGESIAEVKQAFDIVNVMRAESDREALLNSYRARRELAALEGRDPKLIEALDKMIGVLIREIEGISMEEFDRPTTNDHLYLDSDGASEYFHRDGD
jgi:TIR domain/von Willebrand factor type A domain